MNLTIEWQQPTVAAALRAAVETLVANALHQEEFLKHKKRGLVVNFVPDIPSNSPLVATIVDARTGKLLGAIESPNNGLEIQIIRLLPNVPMNG